MKGQNLYFSTVFSKKLDEWLSKEEYDEYGNKKRRTQADFAKHVGLHPNMITRYKKGEAYPQDQERLEWIAQALDSDVSDFIPATPTEKLAFDDEYRESFLSNMIDLELQMIQSMGIDLGFWKFFISIEGIYDFFPFEYPDRWIPEMIQGKKNSRGKKVGFTKKDLIFVKELQNETETTISVLSIKKLIQNNSKGEKNEQARND